MNENRRDNTRHVVAVTAEVLIAGEVHEGKTRDLSHGGVNVEIYCEPPDGATVGLTLLLTQDGVEDATADPFEVNANVVWSAPTDNDSWIVGLRFAASAGEQQRVLERFLASLAADAA